jgi:hypothetical protein
MYFEPRFGGTRCGASDIADQYLTFLTKLEKYVRLTLALRSTDALDIVATPGPNESIRLHIGGSEFHFGLNYLFHCWRGTASEGELFEDIVSSFLPLYAKVRHEADTVARARWRPIVAAGHPEFNDPYGVDQEFTSMQQYLEDRVDAR